MIERGHSPLSLRTPLLRWVKVRFNEMFLFSKGYGRIITQMQTVPLFVHFDNYQLYIYNSDTILKEGD